MAASRHRFPTARPEGVSRSNRLRHDGADGRKSSHAIKIPRTSAGPGQRLSETRPSRGVQRASGWYYDGHRFRAGTVGWQEDMAVEVRCGRGSRSLAEGHIIQGRRNAHKQHGDATQTEAPTTT